MFGPLHCWPLSHAFMRLWEFILWMCDSSETAEDCRMQVCPLLMESSTLQRDRA